MLLLSSHEAGVGLDEASCMNPVVKTLAKSSKFSFLGIYSVMEQEQFSTRS